MKQQPAHSFQVQHADDATMRYLLNRGVVDLIPKTLCEKKIRNGERMRIYLGVDPTGPDIHLGHAVHLRKLRAFQDLGHEVVLVIGDFTARIGDPTDRQAARQPMTADQVRVNMRLYKKQASTILDFSATHKSPARIVYNIQWLAKLKFADIIDLAHYFTVQQLLERDMFAERLKTARPIHLHEFLYPVMQGYDSVALDVDMETGGTDQLFNMLAGRTLMQKMSGKEKIVMTHELLEGLDGRKMSKSYGNIVGIADAPDVMFGKIMSLADKLVPKYFLLCTDVSQKDVRVIEQRLQKGENPRDIKMELAEMIVAIYHSPKKALRAREMFIHVVQQKNIPRHIALFHSLASSMNGVDLLVAAKFVSSRAEARRLIQQGGVRVNGKKITNAVESIVLKDNDIIQVGKRRFVQIKF